jgi:antirestriction protein ArdC
MTKPQTKATAKPSAQPRADVYARVTAKIVEDLAQGVRPWARPWNAGHAAGPVSRPLRANGTPYRGINVLLLWVEAQDKNYTAPIWMTYKQAQAMGAQVRKGETGTLVVFADRLTKTETNDKGEETERQIAFMKGYTVFNVEQIDGLPGHYTAPAVLPASPLPRLDAAESFFAATGADIRHGGNRAFYAPGVDRVQMPPRDSFRDAESYAATLAHELTHWTGHESRLNRDLRNRFGDHAYAAEELIAEMGAAFLCADLGLAALPRPDHAAYLGSWLSVLQADSRAIFTAATQAQRAADYLHSLQPQAMPEEE